MCAVWIGACLQEKVHHCEVAGAARLQQWCDAVVVRNVNLGSGCDQNSGHFNVGAVGRPKQGNRSVTRWSVDISARRNELTYTREITRLHGLRNRTIATTA